MRGGRSSSHLGLEMSEARKEQRVNVRRGQRLVIVLHDIQGWARWQCARSLGRDLTKLLEIEFLFESTSLKGKDNEQGTT